MRTTTMLRLGAAALALALAGCGGSKSENASVTGEGGGGAETASDAPKPTIDPCSLVTKEEVAAITGAAHEAVRQDDTCTYRTQERGDDGVQVMLYLNDGERQMRAWNNANGLLDGMSGDVAKMGGAGADAAAMMKKDEAAAPRIGDEAAWGMNTAIGVRKGPHFFQVTPPTLLVPGRRSGMPLLTVEEKRDIVSRVAEKVAGRLPG